MYPWRVVMTDPRQEQIARMQRIDAVEQSLLPAISWQERDGSTHQSVPPKVAALGQWPMAALHVFASPGESAPVPWTRLATNLAKGCR